tara:strand:+ start:28 stop:714 length:687 start_codon:yes stop_codon:yes gene_type:complete
MEEEAQMMKDQQERWNRQVQEGKVRAVTCKEAMDLKGEGWTILDVRPEVESSKARLEGAVEVPLFEVDTEFSPSSLLKQASAFGMGGWWLGTQHMVTNTEFLPQVLNKVPKGDKVIVACQKGLRSLAACEQLGSAGYDTLAWVNGGLDSATGPQEVVTVGGVDVRKAGIGGVSEMVGWTEIQQAERKASRIGGKDAMLSSPLIQIAILALLVDLAIFVYEKVTGGYGG